MAKQQEIWNELSSWPFKPLKKTHKQLVQELFEPKRLQDTATHYTISPDFFTTAYWGSTSDYVVPGRLAT